MKSFGEVIKEARKAKGLTLAKVAHGCRSHKGYICGIESGAVNAPSPRIIPDLCRVLDLPVGRMLTLAWWEKRPKEVTREEALELLREAV